MGYPWVPLKSIVIIRFPTIKLKLFIELFKTLCPFRSTGWFNPMMIIPNSSSLLDSITPLSSTNRGLRTTGPNNGGSRAAQNPWRGTRRSPAETWSQSQPITANLRLASPWGISSTVSSMSCSSWSGHTKNTKKNAGKDGKSWLTQSDTVSNWWAKMIKRQL